MPRLSNERYVKRHELLRWVWLNHQEAYGRLTPSQQWLVHDYYQPSKELSLQQLIGHRRKVSKDRPGLPAAAGKAGNHLHQLNTGQRAPQPPFRHQQGKREITVRAIVRPEIDVEKLARTFIELAKQLASDNRKRTK